MKTNRRKFIQHGTLGVTALGLGSSLLPPLLADSRQQVPNNTSDEAADLRKFLQSSRSEGNIAHEWQQVRAESFDKAEDIKRFQIVKGNWEVANGQLKATGGLGGIILLAPTLDGAQRVEFDATLLPRPDGRICNVGLFFNAVPSEKGAGSYREGYALVTAQYWNQATSCYRKAIPIARTEWSSIVPGQRHRIAGEWTPEGHLRYFIDGKIVLDAWDRVEPLTPDSTKHIGLWAYETDITVENFAIYAGTPIPKTRPVNKSKEK